VHLDIARVLLSIPYLLFITGFVWIGVLFPKRSQINTFERITYSIVLSITSVILVGLVLQFTSWGIQLNSVTITLACFTLFGSVWAFLRHRILPVSEKLSLFMGLSPVKWRQKSRADKIVFSVLAFCIVSVLLLMTYVLVKPKNNEKFSEFYLLGTNDKAENYPEEVVFGQTISLTVGITNQEKRTTEYDIGVFEDGTKVSEIGPVFLEDTLNWQEAVTIKPQKPGDAQKIEFVLYKNGNTKSNPQSLHFWLDVK
jgi:uncharacterized membrane protein